MSKCFRTKRRGFVKLMQLRTLLHKNTGCVFIIIHSETSTFLNPTAPELECDWNLSPIFSVPSFKWFYIQVLKHGRPFISLNENRIEVTEFRHVGCWEWAPLNLLFSRVQSSTLECILKIFLNTCLCDVLPYYCNSSYENLDQLSIQYLQLVQNEAAHLLGGKRQRDRIIPVLHSVLWLPVHCRLDFNMLLLVCKASNGLVLSYLSELHHVSASVRAVRLTNQLLLDVPKKSQNQGQRRLRSSCLKSVE